MLDIYPDKDKTEKKTNSTSFANLLGTITKSVDKKGAADSFINNTADEEGLKVKMTKE